tara:strand:- start:357 stop:584 length:228 start_codon:yes stop_codon:yes gene_type:complete
MAISTYSSACSWQPKQKAKALCSKEEKKEEQGRRREKGRSDNKQSRSLSLPPLLSFPARHHTNHVFKGEQGLEGD